MNIIKKMLLASSLITGQTIFARPLDPMHLYSLGADHTLKNGKAVIFIHGTTNILPIIEPLFGWYIDDWCFSTGEVLSSVSSKDFPRESFYIYRWPGTYNANVRFKSAERLYHHLKDFKGELTIIGHSHGGTIALYLAEMCKRFEDVNFKVDKLILLATPVQQRTAHYMQSKIFKKVYAFYSTADLWQVIAVQLKKVSFGKRKRTILAGSERIFPDIAKLTQARILMDHKSPNHLDFFCAPFLKKLPAIINFLDQKVGNKSHVILDIPSDDREPRLIQKNQMAYAHHTRPPRVANSPRQ